MAYHSTSVSCSLLTVHLLLRMGMVSTARDARVHRQRGQRISGIVAQLGHDTVRLAKRSSATFPNLAAASCSSSSSRRRLKFLDYADLLNKLPRRLLMWLIALQLVIDWRSALVICRARALITATLLRWRTEGSLKLPRIVPSGTESPAGGGLLERGGREAVVPRVGRRVRRQVLPFRHSTLVVRGGGTVGRGINLQRLRGARELLCIGP